MTNEEVLRIKRTKKVLLTVRMRPLKFCEGIMKKEGMENLILTGYSEGNRSRSKQQITCLPSLYEWMIKQVPQSRGEIIKSKNYLEQQKRRSCGECHSEGI